jgi:hypothetical protein
MTKRLLIGAVATLTAGSLFAGVPTNLPYPSGKLTDGKAVMEQVYYVNHFFGFKNYSIQASKGDITVIVKKSEGKPPLTETVERYLNNDYENDTEVKSKDLAIFRAGKMKGTGMLITDYDDDAKSQEYLLWLPALRKIRRFAQPAHDDAWGGTDFTFGDVTLRKPLHEDHKLLRTETFGKTVASLVIPEAQQTNYTKALPGPSDDYKNKEVYVVESATKFESWWYDKRISYVDTTSFADYRVEYFKNGKMIKFIDKQWPAIEGQKDPRNVRWYTWYGKNVETNHESLAFIPQSVTFYNQAEFEVGNKKYAPEDLWSQRTLTKIKQ